jgi:hypothetical protein
MKSGECYDQSHRQAANHPAFCILHSAFCILHSAFHNFVRIVV